MLQIEILNPLNGELSLTVSDVSNAGVRPEDDAIAGLHLFRRQRVELTPRYNHIVIFLDMGMGYNP